MASNLTPAQNGALSEFCQILNTEDIETAKSYLASNEWNLEAAIQSYAEDQDEQDSAPESEPQAPSTGPRTLGGDGVPSQPAPPSEPSSSKPSKPPAQKKKFASLRDFQGNEPPRGGGGGGGADDEDEKDQEYFAGGDKSGLAVQGPGTSSRDHVRRLLERARRNGPPAPPEEEAPQSHFTGAGMTLGGDDVESQRIEDPNANAPRAPTMVQRTLHLWADGFSVDDGPLYRYDDPANARTLEMINRGSAPLDIMNVETGQAVDVNLEQHREENYVQPKKKYKPFSGGGQRLGSPVPGASSSSSSAAPSTAIPAASSSTTEPPKPPVDESQPTITLQIRLADGTRMPSRFNTTQTIGAVYDFVNRASPASAGRAYALATTFPTKELTDKDQILGDMAEFKRGGVVVQKWS